jgi:DNA-binding CsgD family transcriptional regulator
MYDFQNLFSTISQAKDRQDLRAKILPELTEYFLAKRSGLFFFDEFDFYKNNFSGQFQVALNIEKNPILRYVLERHKPVHEKLLVNSSTWKLICPRKDHWHVMAGPFIDNNQLVGGIGFTREREMHSFNTENLLDLSAICLHISNWLNKIYLSQINPQQHCLTSRELEIARLVARGQTNSQIGTELWITQNTVKQALKRIFRKLDVKSRAEMVSKLYLKSD